MKPDVLWTHIQTGEQNTQWQCQELSLRAIGQEVSPSPSGVQEQSPGTASGGCNLQTLFTDFDCRNDQNLKIHLLILDPSMFHGGG